MNGVEGFIAILQDDLGLDVTSDDAGKNLDQVACWDSVHLIELLTVLELQTGRRYSLPGLLAARTITELYETVARQ